MTRSGTREMMAGVGAREHSTCAQLRMLDTLHLRKSPMDLRQGEINLDYRGASPIRKRPHPYDPPRTIGIGLQ